MIDVDEFSGKFEARYGSKPLIVSAPGRVNLIGEHTDYNEGFVLPFAIDKATFVGASPRNDNIINAYSLTLNQHTQFNIDDLPKPERGDWSIYVVGMIETLKRRRQSVVGADLLIDSDIPFGAGLSSSAALEMAVGLALTEMAGDRVSLRDLAFDGQRVEHEFAGVRSGIMDQFASVLSLPGHALFIDCRSLVTKHVPLELGDAILVVCDTQVKHSLASSAYNTRREECERGVELLSAELSEIVSLRDVTIDAFQQCEDILPEPIRRRCRHVITENARTLKTVEALSTRDLIEVGHLMNLSHDSLRNDYEVSCAELDLLVETAREMREVYGARMTGGGFGGCTINLLKGVALEEFTDRQSKSYRKTFNREANIFAVKPSAGAHRIA